MTSDQLGGIMAQTILIIDDEESIRNLLKHDLEDAGYKTIEAIDGISGLKSFEENNPEAIITDIRMPNVDGITMVQKIRDQNATVPIIALSGYSFSDERLAACQVDGLLKKPYAKQQLLNFIQTFLSRRG